MATTYGQLSALLTSGVPLLRSLEVIRQQTPHKNCRRVLEDVHTRVQEGATLADAMARHPRASASSARASSVPAAKAASSKRPSTAWPRFTEQQDELKSRVMGALAYPMILFMLGTVVVNVLVIFFVPKFETLFARLKPRGELPAVTEWLLWTQPHAAVVRPVHCWPPS